MFDADQAVKWGIRIAIASLMAVALVGACTGIAIDRTLKAYT